VTTRPFANLAAGGQALAQALLHFAGNRDVIVVAVLPGGAPVGVEVAAALGLPIVAAEVTRTDDGAVGDVTFHCPAHDVAGRIALVVDDAVESGSAALAVGERLRELGAARRVLAIPLCPNDSAARIELEYDEVIALIRPEKRGPLSDHYEVVDIPTLERARSLVLSHSSIR